MVKNSNVRIVITLPKNLLDALEKYSLETGLSKSSIIKIALFERFALEELNSIRWTKPK